MTKRAPWYAVVVACGGAALDVILSDEDEARLAQAIYETGEALQIWASRWDGSAEALTVIPGVGVRWMSRAARPIPLAGDRPAGPADRVTAEVHPTDSRYAQFARPATLRPVRYSTVADAADEMKSLRLLIGKAMMESHTTAAPVEPDGADDDANGAPSQPT